MDLILQVNHNKNASASAQVASYVDITGMDVLQFNMDYDDIMV